MISRDAEIKAAQDAARYNDTLILQKVNASHRIAFADKYPGQVEHVLRLITERLQSGLTKTDTTDLHNPDTWILDCKEISDLAHAMAAVNSIRNNIRVE
jgi:hypothetical protein